MPAAKLDDKFYKTFGVFISQLEAQIDKVDYEVIVLTADTSAPRQDILSSNITIFKSSEPLWNRLCALTRARISSPLTALITSDDLWNFSKSDLIRFRDSNSKVGLGNFLCARPIDQEKLRLFSGWMQFRDYMHLPPTRARFQAYIGEAPVTAWGLYDTSYLLRLLTLVSNLLPTFDKAEHLNLIEDCVNLLNLTQKTCFLNNSICIRFFDSNFGMNPGWKLSLHCIEDMVRDGKYGILTKKLAQFTHESKNQTPDGLYLDEIELGQSLVAHAIGYAAASSRKWRSWLDVEFYPLLPVQPGVIPNAGSPNKYDVAYRLSGKARPQGTFPSWSWMSDKIFVDALYSIPQEIWALHIARSSG
jgi:hypothetical protein